MARREKCAPSILGGAVVSKRLCVLVSQVWPKLSLDFRRTTESPESFRRLSGPAAVSERRRSTENDRSRRENPFAWTMGLRRINYDRVARLEGCPEICFPEERSHAGLWLRKKAEAQRGCTDMRKVRSDISFICRTLLPHL
jgi:hypothetical protein